MRKKLLILMLITALALSGCGGSSSETVNASETLKSVEQSNESEKNEDSTQKETDESIETVTPEINFEEITVIDNEQCTIIITSVEPGNKKCTLKALLENKSSDKTYMFAVENAFVNGVDSDPMFATEVAAGKKSNKTIDFTSNYDIGDFTDIEITFRVYDSNDWSADNVGNDTIHIYPYGEENAIIFERKPQDTDNIIADNEYVKIIVTGIEPDEIWGYTVNLFLINKSDKEVMFSVDDASVNGYMIDPFYATSVMPGKCKFSSMSWSANSLEENGISEVEIIEFLLRAHDNSNFMGEDFINEVITLTP